MPGASAMEPCKNCGQKSIDERQGLNIYHATPDGAGAKARQRKAGEGQRSFSWLFEKS